jgi:hypothetical protein
VLGLIFEIKTGFETKFFLKEKPNSKLGSQFYLCAKLKLESRHMFQGKKENDWNWG